MTPARNIESRLVDGKYALGRELGSGGAGTVYEAEHLIVGKRVALKLLRPELAHDPALQRRFVAEARAAARIAHANVVDIHDLGVARDGTCYLVMELLAGETLFEMLERRGALSPPYACELMLQVLAGLRAAHAQGIVHRDLKPANVMVTHPRPDRPLVKVLDFGIAKGLLDPGLLDESNIVLGTPAYMAPEQAAGADVDERADVYSTAAILYELLAGQPPFEGDSPEDVLSKAILGRWRPLGDVAPWLPPGLVEAVEDALCRDPDRRPASAAAFARRLRPFVSADAPSVEPWPGETAPPLLLAHSGRGPLIKHTLVDASQPLPSIFVRARRGPDVQVLRLPPRDPAVSDSLLRSPRIPAAPCTPREVIATNSMGPEPRLPATTAVEPPPEPATEPAPEPELPAKKAGPGARAVLLATALGFSVGVVGAWLAGLF